MKLKIFPVSQITETKMEEWTKEKIIYNIIGNDNALYIFYDEGGRVE